MNEKLLSHGRSSIKGSNCYMTHYHSPSCSHRKRTQASFEIWRAPAQALTDKLVFLPQTKTDQVTQERMFSPATLS